MRTTLANVWHPIGGISISDLGERRFIFRLYNAVDADRLERGGPWNFNSHLLILHRLSAGDDPLAILLVFLDYWVLVHDVPIGFMSKKVARALGNFLGVFIDYDSTALSLGYRRIMRIRARLDTRLPLKRRKKLILGNGLGESYCPQRLNNINQNINLEWDASLRAPPRRAAQPQSRWLREEGAVDFHSWQPNLVGYGENVSYVTSIPPTINANHKMDIRELALITAQSSQNSRNKDPKNGACEVLHSLKKKRTGRKVSFALKLDMSLSSLLLSASTDGSFKGVRISRSAPLITDLFFSDDSLIFEEASREGGLNFEKSSAFFSSNVTETAKSEFCQVLDVAITNNVESYLGLPSIVGRNKRNAFLKLKEKFHNRVQGWSSRLFSMGGKEVFIKFPVGKVTSSPSTQVELVSDLIDMDERSWNIDLINSIFNEEDVESILGIRLLNSNQNDILCWKGERSGLPVSEQDKDLIVEIYIPTMQNLFTKRIFGGQTRQATVVSRIGFLGLITKDVSSSLLHPHTHVLAQWTPSLEPTAKLNVDACFSHAHQKSCSGFITRDGAGFIHNHRIASVFMAETLAILQGEQERVELLLQSLSDSYDQLIINLTNSNVTSLVFDDVAAVVLQEENRRKNKKDRQVNLQQAEALTTIRGRSTERGQSSSHKHGRSKSRSKKNLKCYNCRKNDHLKKDY
ncbi:hypothetical protein F3Y22_tig00111342pilonHSYRG00154 [Hibiscus syriacus]|uniref:DUF4283 domain-containing protein n=1 Tax=Hibiscus syriacus TaxID=106335 RepID=A0A6A2YP53_HIBSY|nr:hypothetical protein F3Y22_tig00111342pilonHSYRG00154 [Hibiscus syriacus]